MIDWVRIDERLPADRGRLLEISDGKDVAHAWYQGEYRGRRDWQVKPFSWLPFAPTHWRYVEFPK